MNNSNLFRITVTDSEHVNTVELREMTLRALSLYVEKLMKGRKQRTRVDVFKINPDSHLNDLAVSVCHKNTQEKIYKALLQYQKNEQHNVFCPSVEI